MTVQFLVALLLGHAYGTATAQPSDTDRNRWREVTSLEGSFTFRHQKESRTAGGYEKVNEMASGTVFFQSIGPGSLGQTRLTLDGEATISIQHDRVYTPKRGGSITSRGSETKAITARLYIDFEEGTYAVNLFDAHIDVQVMGPNTNYTSKVGVAGAQTLSFKGSLPDSGLVLSGNQVRQDYGAGPLASWTIQAKPQRREEVVFVFFCPENTAPGKDQFKAGITVPNPRLYPKEACDSCRASQARWEAEEPGATGCITEHRRLCDRICPFRCC